MSWHHLDLHEKSNLTNGQLMLWTGLKMNPDDPIYNIIFTFEIQGEIDEDLFRKSFDVLVQKSDVLRTVFVEKDDIPFQHVLSEIDYDFRFEDFTNLPDPEAAQEKWLEEHRKHVYDLSKLLFDVSLLKLSDSRFLFAFNQHHLIADAWGQFVLFNKLETIYSALLKNEPTEYFQIQPFSEYLNFEKKHRLANNTRQEDYWKSKADKIEPIKLYGLENGLSTKADRLYFELGFERSEKLKKVALSERFRSFNQDLSIYQIFCSAIFLYLHKVSDQHNLSFGTPTHNRLTPKFKDSPGLFMEFFPLQILLEEEETLWSLHKKVVEETLTYFQNVKPGLSTPEVNRKFNVVFNYVNATVSDFAGNSVASTYEFSGHNDPRHSLLIQANDYDNTGNIKVQIDLKTEWLSSLISDFIPDQLLKCLDAFLELEDTKIAEVEIIGDREKDYQINGLNNTLVNYEEEGTLINLFQKQVLTTPDRLAVKFEQEELSYCELDKRSNQLAQYMVAIQVAPGDVVGLFLHRSIDMVLSILAIQKAGAAYLPIEPSFPSKRISYILKNSECKKIISHLDHEAQLQPFDIEKIYLDGLKEVLLEYPEKGINLSKEDHLAYVIYTSGSTGNPKGVKIQHSAIKNRVLWMKERYPVTSKDRLLQKTPYTFDISVWEFFWPLVSGVPMIIAKPEGHKDPKYLKEMINEHKISLIHFVPSMLSVFLEEKDLSTCASLIHVFCSGEALTMALEDKLLNTLDVRLHNLYGPTEAAVEVVTWECKRDFEFKEIPIGKPVPNTQTYILDNNLRPVPFGMMGTLYLGGKQLSSGYINNEQLTLEKFIESPFQAQRRIYNTGDLAKYGKYGNILFRGRKDDQIKLRGFRIELSEIESTIRKHDQIKDAVVLFIEDTLNPYLKAYFTANSALDYSELIRFISTDLPDYMVPSAFQQIDQFSLNHSGKIDRKELLVNNFNSPEFIQLNKEDYVAPSNDMEEMIQEVWEEVFQRDGISIHQNFMALGGESLIAIRIISRIREILEIDLPIFLIFDKPTIAIMAHHIEALLVKLLEEDDS